MSKVGTVLIGFVIFVATLIYLAIGSSLKHSTDILEYEHPSKNIRHSTDKGIFIDTLDIVSSDTAEFNDIDRLIKIVPTTSWIEKATYWKSGTMDLDSLGFHKDTVNLVVQFESFVNGQRWTPINSGHFIGEFKSNYHDSSKVYIEDNAIRLDFKMSTGQVTDTIQLVTKNKERIIIKRRD